MATQDESRALFFKWDWTESRIAGRIKYFETPFIGNGSQQENLVSFFEENTK